MKLWVFGGSGVLGRHVVNLAEERGHSVFDPTHETCPIESRDAVYGLFAEAEAMRENGPRIPDAIINCAGTLSNASIQRLVMTNGLGPHNLAHLGIRMIHMSTDAVFQGRSIRGDQFRSKLRTDNVTDPLDLYGRSKLLGESMLDHVLIVRGSFIDPKAGFLHWLLNARKIVDAWAGAYWNGTSAKRMAGHLIELAEGDRVGICHVAAHEPVTKAWMIEYFVEQLDLRLDINVVRELELWRVLEPDVYTVPVEVMCDELIAEIQDTL